MLKRHQFIAAGLLALAAAGLPATAKAGPCVLGTGSTTPDNTCVGAGALASNTTGSINTASGKSALTNNTTGSGNTASGYQALFYNTIGESNTAIGGKALAYNTTGGNNTASGYQALIQNTSGMFNTAHGGSALMGNTTGGSNTATGVNALANNTTGNYNTASGAGALANNTTGSNNIALGYNAGLSLTTGSRNIVIGNAGNAADLNTIRIGVQGTQTRTFVAGIRGTTIASGQTVVVDANGQLGITSSSRRYKEDIKPMGEASNPLMQLRPVTFRYRQAEADGSKPIQYGLIAEEVEQVMPDLVVYNKDGTAESVAYQVLPGLLLNEYQKQGHELAAAKAKLAVNDARFDAMEAELAALRLAVGRLAAAPASVKLAKSQP